MADTLSDAKKLLEHANKTFPTSMAKAAGVNPPAAKPAMPTPKPVAPPVGNPEGNVGKEIADKVQNVKQYNDAAPKEVPKMHEGGEVKETGPVILKEDETVRTKQQEKAVDEKLKGTKAKDLMTKDEPKAKDGKNEVPKDGKKKKKHSFRRTVIDHHTDGTHTMTHEHETDPKGNVTGAKADLMGVHGGLDENIGEPVAPPAAAPMAQGAPAAGAPVPAPAPAAAPPPGI